MVLTWRTSLDTFARSIKSGADVVFQIISVFFETTTEYFHVLPTTNVDIRPLLKKSLVTHELEILDNM